MNRICKIIVIVFCLCVVATMRYCYLYYPQQSMPVGSPVTVLTPDTDRYHHDCLHPCVRYSVNTKQYYMAQSPYYGWNNKLENPLFYVSESARFWCNGILISDTPPKGYNSDPNILLFGDSILYLWRECFTPLCDSLSAERITVGGLIRNNKVEKRVYAINKWKEGDTEQAPVMIVNSDKYLMYASWYQYEPFRSNRGVAIWEGNSILEPDFHLEDTIPIPPCYTVDKSFQLRVGGRLFFFPKRQRHDIWHFDLFEYDKRLYMVSVAEKGDNIMLSVSDDYKHFKTARRPLINNHYSESLIGYRQYYYKPTALVQNDSLYVFYTANSADNPQKNQLFLSVAPLKDILK